MNQPSTPHKVSEKQDERITELEMRIAFLEDTVDGLNEQLSAITQQFGLAKEAMQLLNRRVEQMQSGPAVKDFSEETPPPHY